MAAQERKQSLFKESSGEPVYRRVAQALTQRILSGQLPAGTRLDVERDLANQFKLSRNTLRNALTMLEAQGLVRRVPRQGVFVTGQPAARGWSGTTSAILFVNVWGSGRPMPLDSNSYYGGIHAGAAEMAATMGLPIRTEWVPGQVQVPLRAYRPPKPDQVAGVIVLGTFDEQYIQMYASEGVPVVVVDYWTHCPQADSVVVDVESDVTMALDHLAQRGHKTVGFCAIGRKEHGGGDAHAFDPDVWRMLDYLRRAAPEYRIEMRDQWVLLDPWSRTALVQPIRDLLRSRERPTAMICFSFTSAKLLLRGINEARLRCPEDMSVITRGDAVEAGRHMTCLEGNPRQMGRMAVQLLVERIQGRRQQAVRLALVGRLTLGTSTTFAPGTTRQGEAL